MNRESLHKSWGRVFLGAFALIRNPETWTQGKNARTSNGQETDPRLKYACSYCSLGAILKYHVGNTHDAAFSLISHFTSWCRDTYGVQLYRLNDESSHDEIVQVWINYGKHMKYLPETFTVNDPTPEV